MAQNTVIVLCIICPYIMPVSLYLGLTLSFYSNPASVFVENGQMREAEQIYRELVHRNPSNYFYLEQLEKCLKLYTAEARLKFYMQLQEDYPYSHVIRRLPLTFCTGDLLSGLLTA